MTFEKTTFEFLNEDQTRALIKLNLANVDPILILQHAASCRPVTIKGVNYWSWAELEEWFKSLSPDLVIQTPQ